MLLLKDISPKNTVKSNNNSARKHAWSIIIGSIFVNVVRPVRPFVVRLIVWPCYGMSHLTNMAPNKLKCSKKLRRRAKSCSVSEELSQVERVAKLHRPDAP